MKRKLFLFWVAVCLLAVPLSSFGQAVSGSLLGAVSDSSQTPHPAASHSPPVQTTTTARPTDTQQPKRETVCVSSLETSRKKAAQNVHVEKTIVRRANEKVSVSIQ